MWGRISTYNYNNAAPGFTATLARVIVNRANKTGSQIETRSQIAATTRIEEELMKA